jgi:hypothetical protein
VVAPDQGEYEDTATNEGACPEGAEGPQHVRLGLNCACSEFDPGAGRNLRATSVLGSRATYFTHSHSAKTAPANIS